MSARASASESAREEILGFQVRTPIARLPAWSEDRRQRFLLRPEVARPLSVDATVWPLAAKAETVRNGLDLFPDFVSRKAPGVVIAISVSGAAANELRGTHRIDRPEGPGSLETGGLELLGYDIADRWLLSGMMNCGLGDAERSEMSGRFGPLLNEQGLFRSADDAGRFRVECDRLVPEHAPFIVYGLWAEPNWRTS